MQTTLVPTAAGQLHDTAEIRQRLAESERLTKTKHWKVAADLLWSAFEAAVRLSLTQLGEQTDRPIQISDTSSGLSTQAVAYGIIDPADRDSVLRLLSLSTVDTDVLQQVKQITERTLDEMAQ